MTQREESNPIIAYKGFDKDLKCRGFQYEVGKTYEKDGEIRCCSNGFHACENPLDVFLYYAPSDSRYCRVEQSGTIDSDGGDSKTASSRIRVSAEIGLKGLVEAGVRFILDKVNWNDNKESNTGNHSAATNTGDYSAATNTGNHSAATNTGNHSAATNTGYHSAATNTGDYSAATNTGDYSAAIVEGKDSIAIATGYMGKAKGKLGCWIVVTERDVYGHILSVKAAMVDGKAIKEDTFYQLVDGELKEAEK